jgi:hypothetical protein
MGFFGSFGLVWFWEFESSEFGCLGFGFCGLSFVGLACVCFLVCLHIYHVCLHIYVRNSALGFERRTY